MTVKDLERRHDYGYWANRRLFRVISELTPEQFTRTVAGSYGSIRNPLVHTLSAEWGWLDRCGGAKRGPAFKPDDYSTLQSLVASWSTVEAHAREFLSNLKDTDLERTVEFTNPRGEKRSMVLGPLLQHAANHCNMRPTQFTIVDRSPYCFGRSAITPGSLDLLFYDAEKRGAPGW